MSDTQSSLLRRVRDPADELGVQAMAIRVNAARVLAAVREQCADYLEELGDA